MKNTSLTASRDVFLVYLLTINASAMIKANAIMARPILAYIDKINSFNIACSIIRTTSILCRWQTTFLLLFIFLLYYTFIYNISQYNLQTFFRFIVLQYSFISLFSLSIQSSYPLLYQFLPFPLLE